MVHSNHRWNVGEPGDGEPAGLLPHTTCTTERLCRRPQHDMLPCLLPLSPFDLGFGVLSFWEHVVSAGMLTHRE